MSRYTTSGTKTTIGALNTELEKIAESFQDCLVRSGEAPNTMLSDLDMDSQRIINLPPPATSTEPLRLGDVQAGTVNIQSVNITTDNVLTLINNTNSEQISDVVLCYGFTDAGDGGLSYWRKTSDTGTPSQTPVDRGAYELTDADGAVWELISEPNAVVLGADPRGVADSTDAFNLWFETELNPDNGVDGGSPVRYGDVRLTIPHGIYSVSTLNLTQQRFYRNVHIVGFGTVFVANTANKNVFDCVSSRWLWFWGLTVMSPEGVQARTAFQLGELQAEATGNNKFYGVQCIGNWGLAAFVNSGSETTQFYSCRFSQQNTAAGTYAFVGDGQNQLGPYSSDYATVTRPQGSPVSFTNNAFYGCQFRNIAGGSAVYLSRLEGWLFDESCYFLSYDNASVEMYVASDSRSLGLSLSGLHETKQTEPPYGGTTNGLQDIVRFTGNGTSTLVQGVNFKLRRPVSAQACIATDGTTGAIELKNAILEITNTDTVPTQFLFNPADAGLFEVSGEIKVDRTAFLNLETLTSFNGTVITDTVTGFNSPTTGAYTAVFFEDDQQWNVGTNKVTDLNTGWNIIVPNGGNAPVEGRLNAIVLTSDFNVTAISAGTDNQLVGLEEVIIRTTGSGGDVTVVNDINSIRTLSGSNVTLGDNDVIHLIRVDAASNIWQQIGGTL
jgi:hypothetical protein